MPIEVTCQGCHRVGRVPDAAAGKKTKCPACGTIMVVPISSAAPTGSRPPVFEDDEPARPAPRAATAVGRPPMFDDDDFPAPIAPPPAAPSRPRPAPAPAPAAAPARAGANRGFGDDDEIAPAPQAPSGKPAFLDDDDLFGPSAAPAAAGVGGGGGFRGRPARRSSGGMSKETLGKIGGGVVAILIVVGGGVKVGAKILRRMDSSESGQQAYVQHAPPQYPGFGPPPTFQPPSFTPPAFPPPPDYPGLAGGGSNTNAGQPPRTTRVSGFGPGASAGADEPPGTASPPAPRSTVTGFSGGAGGGNPSGMGVGGGNSGFGAGPGGGALPGAWGLQPDPSPLTFKIVEGTRARFPAGAGFGGAEVLFPATPSPHFALGRMRGDRDVFAVHNLETGKAAGGLRGKYDFRRETMALSPDGSLIAGAANFEKGVFVFSTRNGQLVGRIEPPFDRPDFVEFGFENHILIGSKSDKSLRVHDPNTGAETAVINLPNGFSQNAWALSPGGRFLAIMLDNRERIVVLDLKTGSEAADQRIDKEGPFGCEPVGLAFSPDGKHLSALLKTGFGPDEGRSLRTWDVATGELESDHRFKANELPKPRNFTSDPQLVWMPDADGWLVSDQALVERKSGQKFWTLPFTRNQFPEGPRRMLDAERVLAATGDGSEFRIVPLPGDRVRAVMDVAKAGGEASDGILPPLTAADMKSATMIAFESNAAWSARAEGVAPPKLAHKAIPLGGDANETERVLISGPEKTRAFASLTPGRSNFMRRDDGTPPDQRRIEVFDLERGARVAQFEMSPVVEPLAVAPDGGAILTVATPQRGRLDVWDATKGAHVVGWRPDPEGTPEARKVVWAGFVAADKVLTLMGDGRLARWTIPSCAADYVVEGVGPGPLALSPNRSLVASANGGVLRVHDTATGRLVGVGPEVDIGPNAANPTAPCAFRPDGGALAVAGGTKLHLVDLADGRVETIETGVPGVKTLAYSTNNYFVLLDNRVLFDVVKKAAIWNYTGIATHAVGSPDGAMWYAAGVGSNNALHGLGIPEPNVLETLRMANTPDIPAIVKAGASVSFAMEGVAPPKDADAYQRELRESYAAKLRASGLNPAEGGRVRFVLRMREGTTGETITFRNIGPGAFGGPATTSVPERTLDAELVLEDGAGPPISLGKHSLGNRTFGIVHTREGESLDEMFRRQLWDGARMWATGFATPAFVARRGNQLIMMPGLTNLNLMR